MGSGPSLARALLAIKDTLAISLGLVSGVWTMSPSDTELDEMPVRPLFSLDERGACPSSDDGGQAPAGGVALAFLLGLL